MVTQVEAEAVALEIGAQTWRRGPSQVSLAEIPGRDWLYLFNWITEPSQRSQGHAGALLRAVCDVADQQGIILVTHPDDDRLRETFERHGFVLDPVAPKWGERPFMSRQPISPNP